MNVHSLNDYIYFRLTETGETILKKWYSKLRKECPPYVGGISYYCNDWLQWQLWEVMQVFGPQLFCGKLPPITDITFDDPKTAEGEK